MNDKQILDMLWQRDEKAIDAMQQQYGKYCRYVAMRIVEDEQDADEILNDTWLTAWNNVPPQQPEPFKAYLGALCRNLAIDRYREKYAQKRTGQTALCLDELAECVPDNGSALDAAAQIHLRDTLTAFLYPCRKKHAEFFLADIGTTHRFPSLPTLTACAKTRLPICCSAHAKNSNKHSKRRAFSYDKQRSLPRAVRR